jgi:hypothetical protein
MPEEAIDNIEKQNADRQVIVIALASGYAKNKPPFQLPR